MIFTSHRWGEVANLADRITIFRNGEHVATRDRLTEGEAVTLMTGRTIDRMYPELPPLPADAAPVLEVNGLAASVRPRRVVRTPARGDPRRRRACGTGAARPVHDAVRSPKGGRR